MLPAILQIPSIGLEAPVLQGTTDAVLEDSVGHDPSSVWPGAAGVSILEAHDASYFSNLGSVRAGDQVSWVDDCQRLVFRVDKSIVVQPGAALPAPRGGIGLALVTCSPSDALFWTPDRLVVLASFVRVAPTVSAAPNPAPPLGFRVPAPPALAARGLGLEQNSLLVGHWSVGGKPDHAWAEGPDPLRAIQLAFTELAAVEIIVRDEASEWWSAISLPGVPLPGSLDVGYEFDALVTAHGTTITSIRLSSPDQTVDLVVRHHPQQVASVG
jgi:LPXTG-site transpeptidase (sortase) family protein